MRHEIPQLGWNRLLRAWKRWTLTFIAMTLMRFALWLADVSLSIEERNR